MMKKLTANDVLKRINFPVMKKSLFYKENDSFVELEDRKAVVRTDTGDALGLVSNNYQVISNADVFAVPFETMTSKNGGYDVNRFSLFNSGEKTFVEFLSRDTYNLEGKSDEGYKKKIIFSNSYDRSKSLTMIFGMFRLICSNGAGYFQKETKASYRIIHMGDMGKKIVRNKISENIKCFDSYFESYKKDIKILGDAKINPAVTSKILEELKFGKRSVKNVEEIYNANYIKYNSLLGVYHAITWYFKEFEQKRDNSITEAALYRTAMYMTLLKKMVSSKSKLIS